MDDYYYEDDSHDAEPYVIVENRSGGVGTFLLGVALGTGIAMLFAPRSGEETRRRIGRSVRKAGDAARDLVDEVASTVTETIDQARDSVELKKRQVSTAVEAGRAAARQAREELEFRIAESKATYNEL